jgi:deoxyguanosine kinase
MLIVVEGCVGAGKSTVAKGLAACRGSQLLTEDFEANPFLRAFYENPEENAIETEFAFLLLHFHQIKNHIGMASSAEVVADFHLGKDLLYADLNLKDARAKHLFGQLYDLVREKILSPDLMICLSATTDLVIQRIRSRKRDFEMDINPEYYAGVNKAYEEYFEKYPGKKLRLQMDEWDFVKDPTLYERLSVLVNGELGTQ